VHRSRLRISCTLALAAAGLGLAGCVVNAARPYAGETPGAGTGRAVALIGLTVDRPSSLPQFRVVLDQYDVERQAITGGCLSYNRIEATVPNAVTATRFFAFDLPAGHYVYSAFNLGSGAGGGFQGADQALRVPPGQVVYLGNFVLDGGRVTLRRDIAGERVALARAWPTLAPPAVAATAVTVLPAKPFMCTP
jgi:hypothetical protein